MRRCPICERELSNERELNRQIPHYSYVSYVGYRCYNKCYTVVISPDLKIRIIEIFDHYFHFPSETKMADKMKYHVIKERIKYYKEDYRYIAKILER